MTDRDTIAAISTPEGRGAIGIVRLSGKNALSIALTSFKAQKEDLSLKNIEPQKAYLGAAIDHVNKETIDEGLLTYMKAPASYTGEDVVEISLHGNPLILNRYLDVLLKNGAIPAGPGEFTKRAFLNGKMDILQAEAVAELINSKSLAQTKAAMKRIKGTLSKEAKEIRKDLVSFIAEIEAELEFPEDNVPARDQKESLGKLSKIQSSIEDLIKSHEKGEILSRGFDIAIVGKANAGKSTLFNALLRNNRALVSETPGTTRDYLHEQIEMNGILINLYDTAGINVGSKEKIEKKGMEKTFELMESADIVIYVYDSSKPFDGEIKKNVNSLKGKDLFFVANKCDLKAGQDFPRGFAGEKIIKVSALKGENIDELERCIKEKINTVSDDKLPAAVVSNLRQKTELTKIKSLLQNTMKGLKENQSAEFLSFDLKEAYRRILDFSGEDSKDIDEEVLNSIFSKFCIGK